MLKLDSFPTITPPPIDPGQPTILIVDDSLVDRRLAGRLIEKTGEWRAVYAADGSQALDAMTRFQPQAVLTDLQMPVMDGLALVEELHKQFPLVPVVLMTGQGSEEIAVMALKAGAASYVSKRRQTIDLIPAVTRVIGASRIQADRQRVTMCLTQRSAVFELPNDPSLINPMASLLRDELLAIGVCDEKGAMRAGIALEEALLNALYHGNLEVCSELKLENDRSFHELASERISLSPYSDRCIHISMKLTPEIAEFDIRDQGSGFDTSTLPNCDDAEVLLRPFGRGLMLMRLFMDEVRFNSQGNAVSLVKRRRNL